MKNLSLAFVLSLLAFPLQSYALSFSPNTDFLNFTSQTDCELQGGDYTEWYGEEYCTKVGENVFEDVSFSHANKTAINYVKNQGIVGGYDDGTFRPEATINRVELIKIMIESSDVQVSCVVDAAANLNDVDTNGWYYGYLSEAMCAGMVDGYPDGSFKPGNSVTVAEAAKIISNGFGHPVAEMGGAWYEKFVDNLGGYGALPTTISGVGAELTRGEMAEIIYRLKTGTTGAASHTLSSLQNNGVTVESTTQTEAEVDAELDALFEDIFDEDSLDLDSLLDF